jgi:hypothetical protein
MEVAIGQPSKKRLACFYSLARLVPCELEHAIIDDDVILAE